MKDNDFKNESSIRALSQNGTRIECTMESYRKMSEFGEVTVTGYTVHLVTRKLDDAVSVEIAHAKPPKKKKEPELKQLDLFGSLFG